MKLLREFRLEFRIGARFRIRALEFFEDRLTGDTAAPALLSLADHPVLRGISPADLALLEGRLEHRFFAAGDYLMRAGELVSELLLITSGVVSETIELADGGVRRVATLSAGMTIGELALLTGGERIGDARADTEVECHALNLGYRDYRTIDVHEWQDREHEGVLYVPKAGETLYRLKDDPFRLPGGAAPTGSRAAPETSISSRLRPADEAEDHQ